MKGLSLMAVSVTYRQAGIALLILGAVVIGLIVEHLIVTERERITAIVRDVRAAVARGDIDKIFVHVSANYYDEKFSRDQLRSFAAGFFKSHDMSYVRFTETRLNRVGDIALVQARVLASAGRRGRNELFGVSEWQLQLQKEADGAWRITQMIPLKFGARAVFGWSDARKMGGF